MSPFCKVFISTLIVIVIIVCVIIATVTTTFLVIQMTVKHTQGLRFRTALPLAAFYSIVVIINLCCHH